MYSQTQGEPRFCSSCTGLLASHLYARHSSWIPDSYLAASGRGNAVLSRQHPLLRDSCVAVWPVTFLVYRVLTCALYFLPSYHTGATSALHHTLHPRQLCIPAFIELVHDTYAWGLPYTLYLLAGVQWGRANAPTSIISVVGKVVHLLQASHADCVIDTDEQKGAVASTILCDAHLQLSGTQV